MTASTDSPDLQSDAFAKVWYGTQERWCWGVVRAAWALVGRAQREDGRPTRSSAQPLPDSPSPEVSLRDRPFPSATLGVALGG